MKYTPSFQSVCFSVFMGLVLVFAPSLAIQNLRAERFPQDSGARIIAEGVIEPVRWSESRFLIGGDVARVLVQPGDKVAAGDLLVQLDAVAVDFAVREAQAGMAIAQAHLELVTSDPRPGEIAAAESRIAVAQGSLARAVALRDLLTSGSAPAALTAAEAVLAAAQAEQRQSQVTLDWAEDSGDSDRIVPARSELHASNLKVAAAQEQLAGTPRLSAAQLRGVNANVQAAEAQYVLAQAQLEQLKAGATMPEVAVAKAGVRQQQAALRACEYTQSLTGLYAPFAGTVTRVYVAAGDTVAPGQVVVVLADLTHFQVRTTDLLELDVVKITEGQSAKVTVDAYPGHQLDGYVTRIKLQSVLYRGDVTYPVFIALDNVPAGLLWGMTVMVELEETE